MTRTGRPSVPTAIKKLKGSYRKDRATAKEPQPDAGRPTCPAWLSPYGKTAWRYYAPILHRAGTLTKADRDYLAAYCEAVSLLREATEALKRDGNKKVLMTHNGNYVQNPWLHTRKQATADMMKFGAELGIGAGSRTRINVDVPVDEPSLADTLFDAVHGN